ncbi:hypothetical protein GJAV_G00243070 [Gymnothorax javanicus]|nr:hypothetical protein GJAV_G00243070 [Gymnothorax javanicus]
MLPKIEGLLLKREKLGCQDISKPRKKKRVSKGELKEAPVNGSEPPQKGDCWLLTGHEKASKRNTDPLGAGHSRGDVALPLEKKEPRSGDKISQLLLLRHISGDPRTDPENLKPNGATCVDLSSALQRTSLLQHSFGPNPKPAAPTDSASPPKKIKMEELCPGADEPPAGLSGDGDGFEDGLSTLAAVVCFTISNKQEQPCCPSPPTLCTLKSEPEEAVDNAKTAKLIPDPTLDDQSLSLSGVQSLVKQRHISIEQAIAIEALTQLGLAPPTTPSRAVDRDQPHKYRCLSSLASSTHSDPPLSRLSSDASSYKVPVISGPSNQTSVIQSPLSKRNNFTNSSHSLSKIGKLSLLDLIEASSEAEKMSRPIDCEKRFRNQEQDLRGRNEPALDEVGKLDGTFGGHGKNERLPALGKIRRNKEEEEVAIQLAQLAFIIESSRKQTSVSSALLLAPQVN